MTQNPLRPGKARLRPCEASVRPWSGPVEKPPAQARKRPLWGRWGPVLGETAGLGKLAKSVGRKPPSLPFLAALAEGKRDARHSSFWTGASGMKAFSRTLVRGKQSARLSCLTLVLGASPPCPR